MLLDEPSNTFETLSDQVRFCEVFVEGGVSLFYKEAIICFTNH